MQLHSRALSPQSLSSEACLILLTFIDIVRPVCYRSQQKYLAARQIFASLMKPVPDQTVQAISYRSVFCVNRAVWCSVVVFLRSSVCCREDTLLFFN